MDTVQDVIILQVEDVRKQSPITVRTVEDQFKRMFSTGSKDSCNLLMCSSTLSHLSTHPLYGNLVHMIECMMLWEVRIQELQHIFSIKS